MFTLSRVAAPTMALALCLFGAASAWAEGTVLSGMFDGAEPVMDPLVDYGCTPAQYGYRQSTFRVPSDGEYRLTDVFAPFRDWDEGFGNFLYAVYEDSFNPAAPAQNVKRPASSFRYFFTAGVTYVLVVQHACENVEGAWALVVVGPGSVISDDVADVPSFTKGKFTTSDPTGYSYCTAAVAPYQQSGPIHVSRDGTYQVSNIEVVHGASVRGAAVVLQVYTAPINPAGPDPQSVADLGPGGKGWFYLQAGQDYYFVTRWCRGDADGEYMHVIVPPAPLRINPGLTGTWYNPDTPGQGFFLTVYEKLNQVFMAWFTYALDPPAGDEFGHRWITAFGKFEGPSADLAIEWTSGGAFDSAQPVPEQNVDGSILLEFSDCTSGQITYSWRGDEFGSDTVSGVIPIRRPTDDSNAQCESLYAGFGMPGPL